MKQTKSSYTLSTGLSPSPKFKSLSQVWPLPTSHITPRERLDLALECFWTPQLGLNGRNTLSSAQCLELVLGHISLGWRAFLHKNRLQCSCSTSNEDRIHQGNVSDTCVFTNTLREGENEHPKLEGNDYVF